MSEEQLIRDKLRDHNFLESSNKPGLFFHEIEEGTIIFCDLRKGGAPKFYGYINKNEEMPKEAVDKFAIRVKQSLAAIGCATVEKLDSREPTKAEPTGPCCVGCKSVSWTECHSCGERMCKVCGGEIQ